MYPWLVIFLCAVFLFYKYILQVSPSVMTQQLMQFFQIDGAQLGNLVGAYFYVYSVIQLLAGPLLDRYSPRNLIAAAIFLCALGTLIFSTSHVIWYAIVGRTFIGAGVAFATVGYLKMATLYFPPKQFAFITGWLATAAMIGALLGETPVAMLVNRYGWQSSLYGIAMAGFVISVLFYFFVRDKHQPGYAEFNPHLHLKWSDFLAILKRKHNWLLAIYGGLAFEPIAVFSGLWGNPFLQEAYHLSKTGASNYISLAFMGVAIGAPIIGWLSDQTQKRIPWMVVGAILACVSLSSVIYIDMPLWCVGLCLFSLGFATGAYMLGFAIGRDWNPVALVATVLALINTGDAILSSITDPLIGWFLDFFWDHKMVDGVRYFSVHNYRVSLSIMVLYTLLGLVFLYWLHREEKYITR